MFSIILTSNTGVFNGILFFVVVLNLILRSMELYWYWNLLNFLILFRLMWPNDIFGWQLRGWDPDSPQRLLPPPNSGPNWHFCPCWLEQGYVRGLHKNHGAQRRDPGHDPPRSGVPGDLIQPPGLQRVRRESLTGSLQHPRPALAWTAPPLDSAIVTQPLLRQPSSHDPPLLPPAPGQIQCDVWECCHPFEGV